MTNNDRTPAVFEDYQIRRVYDAETGVWYFSVVDVIQVLISARRQTDRKYWNKLKAGLKKEGSQSVTNCRRLKLEAGKGLKEQNLRDHMSGAELIFTLLAELPTRQTVPHLALGAWNQAPLIRDD